MIQKMVFALLLGLVKSGRTMTGQILQRMESPYLPWRGPSVLLSPKICLFFEKVMINANLEDIFDARDATEVVFRLCAYDDHWSRRELVKNCTNKGTLRRCAAKRNCWPGDTNWLPVGWVEFDFAAPSLVLSCSGLIVEAGLPRRVGGELLTKAVFAATKTNYLKNEFVKLPASLPDEIRQLWKRNLLIMFFERVGFSLTLQLNGLILI